MSNEKSHGKDSSTKDSKENNGNDISNMYTYFFPSLDFEINAYA